MIEYSAPLQDMRFVLRELAGLDAVSRLPGYEEATPDVVDAVLEEAGKFASGVLSPLNASGDREGARWRDGEVSTPQGWREAYGQFVAAGWNSLSCDPEHGGQGLPRLVSALVEEMWNGANVSFALCPMLTRGAIEAFELGGSEIQKRLYLPRMVSGEWTGTMNLTEPQAGSDLSAVRTRAVPQADGSYRLFGQKIFISYGEHDLTDNIVHLVLARLPEAPEGVKGISLFAVPKLLVNADGSPAERNDVRCVSIEHKLGIHASPTAVLAFGDAGGARGWLVGTPNRGLEYMFIMMNAARFSVGLEGIGLSQRACQGAAAYSRERIQGTEVTAAGRERVAIIRHPDVRRMLMLMRSRTEAMRALACVVAAAMDVARAHPEVRERQRSQRFVDLMIPVVKGWSTEMAIDNASLGIQVHGGMGYVEETGAAQLLRDARITTIYEGTTGIQATDLVGRKVLRDGGAAITELIGQMREVAREVGPADALEPIGTSLQTAVDALETAVAFIVSVGGSDMPKAAAGAVPFLDLFGTVAGGWQMARAALAAQRCIASDAGDSAFHRAKLCSARFYADHVLARASGLVHAIAHGAEATLAIDDAQL